MKSVTVRAGYRRYHMPGTGMFRPWVKLDISSRRVWLEIYDGESGFIHFTPVQARRLAKGILAMCDEIERTK